MIKGIIKNLSVYLVVFMAFTMLYRWVGWWPLDIDLKELLAVILTVTIAQVVADKVAPVEES